MSTTAGDGTKIKTESVVPGDGDGGPAKAENSDSSSTLSAKSK